MNDCLITGGMLLTMDKQLNVIKDGAVLVRDGEIKALGPASEFNRENIEKHIHAPEKIILPGLVNCHAHLPMSMFRGLADDLPLDVWLNDHIFPAEAKQVNPGSVEKWAALSCREMLASGITTCCDGYFFEYHVVKAAVKTGIRIIAGQGVVDFPAPGVPDPGQNIRTAVEFVQKTCDLSPLVTPSIFCHSAYTCGPQTLVAAKKAARESNILFQIHVSETKAEPGLIKDLDKKTVVGYLDGLGLLDEQTLLVHCVWVDDQDMEIIAKRGSGVAHCPESNMKLASGIAPVPAMLEKGIHVGLGTDGAASNNDQDLMAEMDVMAKLHKVALLDPCVVDARTALKAATIEGAAAIGLSGRIGSIEPGKRADIILVDTDRPHLTPMFDPYSALVYAAKASDVSLVMVDGNIIIEKI